MEKEILLFKSNMAPYWISYAIFIGVILVITSFTTETFTALPDFQGNGKAFVANFLIIPSAIGAIFMGIAMYRLPKCIKISKTDSRVTIDNTNLEFPAEIILESENEDRELFKILITSKGKKKLETGFVYKLKNGPIESYSKCNRQLKLSFLAD